MLDTEGFYIEATSFLITGENIKYLLCWLNSKFVSWAFKTFYAGGGLGEMGYRYKKAFLENLPLPKLAASAQKPFIQLLDKILKAKKIRQDTRDLEKQIDDLIYAVYDLSVADIAFIENHTA